MIYVGSAESEEFDQVLDTIYVGPIPEGRHMFAFQVKLIINWLRVAWTLVFINPSLIWFRSSSGYAADSNYYHVFRLIHLM